MSAIFYIYFLYTLNGPPLKKGVLQISDEGEIISIFDNQEKIKSSYSSNFLMEYYDILAKINTHCHLELSHLHEKIEKELGLLDFIMCVRKRHEFKANYIAITSEAGIPNGKKRNSWGW